MDALGGGALNSSTATGSIILSGYLSKSGKNFGLSVKRWYVLTSNGFFRCFQDKKAKEPKSDIVLRGSNVAIRPAEGKKEPLKLVISDSTDSFEPLILWSEDKDPDTKKWFEALKSYDSTSSFSTAHQRSDVDNRHKLVCNSPERDDMKSLPAHASPVEASNAHAIQRAVQLYNTPVKSNKHAKFLTALGISSSSPLAWIAEHIARPPLPPDWEKLKDEKKRTYYANTSLLQSSWEHPLLFYYPWLCRIFSKMLPIDASTNVSVLPEEIIDFLINESNLLAELNLEAEYLPMHDLKSLQRRVSCDAVFYYTWLFSSKPGQSRNPHLKLSDGRAWDPELVRSVAEYYGIDLAVEPHLIWLPKLALVAPLPPYWTSSEDENGDTLFYCIVSSYCTQGHPVDRYVTLLLQQARLNRKLENHCAAVRAGWFDIINADGIRTWYNMAINESSAQAPPGWDDAEEHRLQVSWNLDIETLIMSLCHIRAQQGLQPAWLLPPSVNAKIYQTDDDSGLPLTSSHVVVSSGDVSFALEASFAGADDELGDQLVKDAILSPSDEIQHDGSISGSEDISDCDADELLPEYGINGEYANFQGRLVLETCDSSIQTDPVEFRAPEVESTSYFVDGFSMSGAVRSGSRLVTDVSLQCSLRPDSKDVSCFANLVSETSLSGTDAVQLQDVGDVAGPHSSQLHDVIAHQRKVCFLLSFIARDFFYPFSSSNSVNFRLSKISSAR
jgi:hypothetical protein